MASVEKAEVKVGMADQVIERLDAKADSLEKTADAMTAGWQILGREFEQFQTVRKWLDSEVASEKISEDEFKAGVQVLTACIAINQKLVTIHKSEAAQHRMASAGVRMAVAITKEVREAEARKGRCAIADLEEEEELRKEEEAFQAGGDSEDEDVPSTESPSEECDREDLPAPEVVEEESSEDQAEVVETSCVHCAEEITISTGSSLCAPCQSYTTRYDRLPPARVLKARKERG